MRLTRWTKILRVQACHLAEIWSRIQKFLETGFLAVDCCGDVKDPFYCHAAIAVKLFQRPWPWMTFKGGRDPRNHFWSNITKGRNPALCARTTIYFDPQRPNLTGWPMHESWHFSQGPHALALGSEHQVSETFYDATVLHNVHTV